MFIMYLDRIHVVLIHFQLLTLRLLSSHELYTVLVTDHYYTIYGVHISFRTIIV